MKYRRGQVYKRGNSEVIDSHPIKTGALVEAGTIAGLDSDGLLVQASSSVTALGVAGFTEVGNQSLVRSGLSVCVAIDKDESPAIGGAVYFDDSTGYVTTTNTETAINAVFASEKLDIEEPLSGDFTKGVLIDFPGGL